MHKFIHAVNVLLINKIEFITKRCTGCSEWHWRQCVVPLMSEWVSEFTSQFLMTFQPFLASNDYLINRGICSFMSVCQMWFNGCDYVNGGEAINFLTQGQDIFRIFSVHCIVDYNIELHGWTTEWWLPIWDVILINYLNWIQRRMKNCWGFGSVLRKTSQAN